MSGSSPWYRILDHTGDVAILVRAPTVEGLFDGATRAMFDVILDVRTVQPRETATVTIDDAMDAEDLLVSYLSELLFLHDARGWLFRGATIRSLTETAIDAAVAGEQFDPDRHVIDRQIKAVTHHHLLLSNDREGWSARCVLDL